MFNKSNHNFNQENSKKNTCKTNTDRKYNVNSLDSTKLIQKLKTEIQEFKVTTDKIDN